MNGFHGVLAAAITPRGSNGEVDYGAGFELVDHLCKGGVSGILLFGPTGEYPAFGPEERARLVYLCVKRSRVPLFAGVGSATLDASLDLAREAQGADAAGLVIPPPLYFRYDQDDLRAYFSQFAADLGSDPPIIIYRTPALAARTAVQLYESGRFGGVIDATGDLDAIAAMSVAGVPVLPDDDAVAASAGRCAMVSSTACAVPELPAALYRALRAKSDAQVVELDRSLQEFVRWAARFPEPAAVRLATSLRGLKTGSLPVPLSPEKQKDLDAFRDWFQRWLPTVRKVAASV